MNTGHHQYGEATCERVVIDASVIFTDEELLRADTPELLRELLDAKLQNLRRALIVALREQRRKVGA